jgi:hypothetical protein
VDRLELMQMLLGHPEADVRVDLGEWLLPVRDVRYRPEQEAIVLLVHPAGVRNPAGADPARSRTSPGAGTARP